MWPGLARIKHELKKWSEANLLCEGLRLLTDLTAEIKFPVVPEMRNCFGNYFLTQGLHLEESASVKYGLLEKDALAYITQPELKLFDGLLLAYSVLCLEHWNAVSIFL